MMFALFPIAACGDETPGGRDLMSPARREASPVNQEALAMDRQERREEDLEVYELKPEKPRKDEPGFDSDLEP